MDTKQVSFIAIMSSLGTVLSGISLYVAPILSATGAGGAALDLSHVATFIAAAYGGPVIGAIVGFLSGIYAGYYFGYVLGSLGLLSLVGVPIGKALTGFVAGFLFKKLKVHTSSRPSINTVPLVLVSYVPESLYTVCYFLYLVPLIYKFSMSFMIPIVIPKGWIEILVMSLLMGSLAGNAGFREFISRFFIHVKVEK
jgi:LytS/YehU family sensor histidine kinase